MDAINPKVDPYLLSQLFTICDLRNLSDPSLGLSFVTTTYTRYHDSPHDHLKYKLRFTAGPETRSTPISPSIYFTTTSR